MRIEGGDQGVGERTWTGHSPPMALQMPTVKSLDAQIHQQEAQLKYLSVFAPAHGIVVIFPFMSDTGSQITTDGRLAIG